MNSLFNVKFNWYLFSTIAILLLLFFPNLSWYSYFALLLTIHQFLLLFFSFGFIIPIRYLFGSLMCLQMLLGPVFAYNGLDNFQRGNYKMQIPEVEYFSYVLPAVICFILGLHIRSNYLRGEFIDAVGIGEFTAKKRKYLPYVFIGIGFISSLVSEAFASELTFVFYLLGSFKYVGAFMLITGNVRLKILPLLFVYGSIFLSSLGEGMFHDLFTWLIFLAAVLSIRYKPKVYIKAIFAVGFILLVTAIQMVKGNYREATWERGEEAGYGALSKAYDESQSTNMFFSSKGLAQNNLRINQGYIITHIMKTVPRIVPYARGSELNDILVAAFLPRILAPDKLTAGNRDIFMKYTNMPLKKNTSMGLSSVGDAYINFGIFAGCIFMLLLGYIYSEVLKGFYTLSKNMPVLLLFTPLVFYYPIRPDCELQTILGHLVKSCFLLFIVFSIWKRQFIFKQIPVISNI